MRPTVFICINGIRTRAGDDDAWTDVMVTALMTRGLRLGLPVFAEKYEYFTLAATRRVHQQHRAEGIAQMVNQWHARGALIVLVGHSNGGDLAERVIAACPIVPFRSVHLFAPAADGEILAIALEMGHVGHAYLHGQTNDRALKLGQVSRKLLGWAGLGYGNLGLRVADFAYRHPRCTPYESHGSDHSVWFKPGHNFDLTIRRILATEFPDRVASPS